MANRFAEKFQAGFGIGQGLADAYERARLREELKAANALAPEQQTLGLNAPNAGAVPTGYEDYITVDTQTGKYVPIADANVNPELRAQQGIMAERFNAPTAFAGERTTYSLGGLSQEKPFTSDQIAQARMERKADIYSNYGKEDVAEQLRTNALARKASSLQIKKLQNEVDDADAFRSDLKSATTMLSSAASVATQAKQLLQSGDREGAARLMAEWRTKNVPDDKQIRVNENGLLEGSRDGGKTWVQASADKGNVYNPNVVETMLGDISASADEHLNRIMFKHAKSPEALSAMIESTKKLAMQSETIAESKRQFGLTYAQKGDELSVTREYYKSKIANDKEELRLKGLLIPSEIEKNLGVGAHYRTANALQDYQLTNLKNFDTEKNAIIKDLDAGKISQDEAQRRLNISGMKFGGKLTETKPLTSTALKDIEEIAANRYTDWAKMPEAKKEEVRSGLKAELGFGSTAAPVDYLSTATKDKGATVTNTGIQNKPAPMVKYSDYDIKNMGIRQAQALYDQIKSKPVQTLDDTATLANIRALQPNIQF